MHALGKSRFNFRDPFFYIADHLQGVFTVTHDHDAADHFTLPVVVGDAPSNFRANPHRSDISQKNGGPSLAYPYRNVANIFYPFDVAAAANHEFGFPHFHHATADIAVAALDGHLHFLQRDVVGLQFIGIHHDLVLFDKTADGSDLRHTFDTGQLIAQEPVLDRTQLRQIVPVALKGVGVYPSHPGGIRPQSGVDAIGQSAGNEIEVFQHTTAGPIHIGTVFEDNVNERNAEERIPSHHTGVGYREHGRRQGIRHLVFDHLRRLTRIFRKDDDLDVRQVGDGIQRNAGHGVKAPGNHKQGRQNDQKLVFYGRFNYFFDHRSARLSVLPSFTANNFLRRGSPAIAVKTYPRPPSTYRSCPVHHPY